MPDINTNPDDSTPNNSLPPVNNHEDKNDLEKNSEEKFKEHSPEMDSSDQVVEESNDYLKIHEKSIPKDSNYQISLISKNLLKVLITTKEGAKINSSVKDKKSSDETQSNEIYLYPKFDYSPQEIEVMITIEDDDQVEPPATQNPDSQVELSVNKTNEIENASNSNYQLNLINENLLKIKIITSRGVRIYSVSRDKKTLIESQTNKIYLQPRASEFQEIEITLAIDVQLKDNIQKDEEGKFKLIPNPEVVDLIQPPTYPVYSDTDEFLNPVTGFKNPFDALRKLIQKNLTIGIIAAVALHTVAAGVVYFNLNKKYKEPSPEDQSRIFVIQDLPDPKIKIEDVEDPNKPKVEEIPQIEDPNKEEPKREIEPRRTVRPPKVNRPRTSTDDEEKDSTFGSDLTNELDSLRKLVEGSDIEKDTTGADTTISAFDIADSLRNNFSENDIGLAMYFPKNWKIMDQREINKNDTAFSGVLLTDTAAEQPGTMTIFIFLDKGNKDFSAENFKTEYKMNDSTLRAYSMEPKTLAGSTSYRFYIFNNLGTEKLSVNAQVRKQFFDQYKNEIEAVVRSIRIRKKEDL